MANQRVSQAQYRAAQTRVGHRPPPPKKKRRRALPFILASLAIVLLTASIFIAKNYSEELEYRRMINDAVNRDVIYEGVMVDGLSLGGMTVEKARAELKARESEVLGRVNITVKYGEQSFPVTVDDIGFSFNTDDVLKKAWDIGRSGDVDTRYAEITHVADTGIALTFSTRYEEQLMRTAAARIAAQINIESFDAAVEDFDIETKTFRFSSESSGIRVDEEALAASIIEAVRTGDFDAELSVKVETLIPAVTRAELSEKMGLMGSFTTRTSSVKERNNNIVLASNSVTANGRIEPGATFSFNKATGRRTPETGYMEAGAYKNGKLIQEPGGGVCQPSSTLFNAFIQSGLSLEGMVRKNHSKTVSYVDPGTDATVDQDSGTDFQFVNSTSQPLWIVMVWDKETRDLTAEIYGERVLEPGVTHELRTEILETLPAPELPVYEIDLTLAVGEEVRDEREHEGYKIRTYLVVKKDGVVVNETAIFNSTYKATPAYYRHNPGILANTGTEPLSANP